MCTSGQQQIYLWFIMLISHDGQKNKPSSRSLPGIVRNHIFATFWSYFSFVLGLVGSPKGLGQITPQEPFHCADWITAGQNLGPTDEYTTRWTEAALLLRLLLLTEQKQNRTE